MPTYLVPDGGMSARRILALVILCLGLSAFAPASDAAARKSHRRGAPRTSHSGRKAHGRRLALPKSHGQLLRLAPHLSANTNQSNNWFGYSQGALEQGTKLFNSVTGDWTVPAARQHTSGQAESSSDWIGVGGGCLDAGCTATDSTLIQTGTEQDVDASGTASYSAWYELVPAPSLTITNMTVAPGDHMHASVAEAVPNSNIWNVTIQDITRGESFTTTVPYVSTHGTAEWIEERPLLIGANAGFASLPNLGNPLFDHGSVNGAGVKLTPAEQMDLTDSNGHVIGVPSGPDSDADGFSACTWTSTCLAPGS